MIPSLHNLQLLFENRLLIFSLPFSGTRRWVAIPGRVRLGVGFEDCLVGQYHSLSHLLIIGCEQEFEDDLWRNAFHEFVNWHLVLRVGVLIVGIETHIFN